MTQGDYDGKAVIISWTTFEEPGSNVLQYSSGGRQYDHTAEAKVLNYTYYRYKSGYIHHCLVDDLEVCHLQSIWSFFLLLVNDVFSLLSL